MKMWIRGQTAAWAAGVILLVSLAPLLQGCGGSGGKDNSPISCSDLSFNRANNAIANGDVYFQETAATCSTIDVGVFLVNLTGIWTVSFDLTYPSANVTYQSFVLGSLLSAGNPVNPPVVIVDHSASGSVRVTMSRLQPDPSVSAVGSQVLITLRFSKVGSGSGIIDFDAGLSSLINEEILDEKGAQRPASFGPGHGGLVTVL